MSRLGWSSHPQALLTTCQYCSLFPRCDKQQCLWGLANVPGVVQSLLVGNYRSRAKEYELQVKLKFESYNMTLVVTAGMLLFLPSVQREVSSVL